MHLNGTRVVINSDFVLPSGSDYIEASEKEGV